MRTRCAGLRMLVGLVVSLFLSVPLLAQSRVSDGWQDDGTVVRLKTLTDFVGIGTANPAAKLDIAGSLRFTADGEFVNLGEGHIIKKWGNQFQLFGGSDGYNLYSEGALASLMRIMNDGNVGIGTTDPQAKLHVVGGSYASSGLEVQGGLVTAANASGEWRSGFSPFGYDADGYGRYDNGTVYTVGPGEPPGWTNAMLGSPMGYTDRGYVGGYHQSRPNAKASMYVDSGGSGVVTTDDIIVMDDSTVYGDTTVYGDATIYGNKYFVQPHPGDASKEIRFVCLEGPEAGTYFRGSSRLASGLAVIDVPEAFRLTTEPEGLTVQVTAIGPAKIWVEKYDLNQITVRGDADVEFHYLVNGVRRGFADFKPIGVNQAYVPSTKDLPYGNELQPALREMLVQNGTLKPDFTPNEATAARLGWKLKDPIGKREKSFSPETK
ncbi:MAG: hypothetical protein AB1486_26070 [Planctomycetota bacterium]